MYTKKTVFIVSLIFLFPYLSALSGDGEMTFCKFGPKFKMHQPTVLRGQTLDKNDSCTGSVKVQGVYWECVLPGNVESKVTDFKEKLKIQAVMECQKHCERRSRNCTGHLVVSGNCGLQTDRDEAVTMGKKMGCRNDCQGQAFAYCSLYDAAFRSEDDARMAKQPPNCQCKKK